MLFLAGALAQTDSDGRNVYKVGGPVSAPRAKHSPPPEYSKQDLHEFHGGGANAQRLRHVLQPTH